MLNLASLLMAEFSLFWLHSCRPQQTSITYVYTGHLSLVREARANNDVVVASIFVNPTQFGPNEDLDKYPRQLERDSELLSEMGVDHLFAPDAASMYQPNHVTYIDPEVRCSYARPRLCCDSAPRFTHLLTALKYINALGL